MARPGENRFNSLSLYVFVVTMANTMGRSAERIWIATLYVSGPTRQKLIEKHGLTVEEVEDAILCRRGLTFAWHDHPQRGRRALVEVAIRSRRVIVVLYPADDPMGDGWNLGSAYPI